MSFIQKFRKHGLAIVPFILLGVFLLTTSPKQLPLALLVVPFILLFICLLVIFLLVLRRVTFHTHRPFARKQFAVAATLAFLPSLVVVLRSIDQLTIKDVLILSVLIGTVVFYVSKLNFGTGQ